MNQSGSFLLDCSIEEYGNSSLCYLVAVEAAVVYEMFGIEMVEAYSIEGWAVVFVD